MSTLIMQVVNSYTLINCKEIPCSKITDLYYHIKLKGCLSTIVAIGLPQYGYTDTGPSMEETRVICWTQEQYKNYCFKFFKVMKALLHG